MSLEIVLVRFKGYLEPPWSSAEKYEYTKAYWNIFAARLGFVLVFEVSLLYLSKMLSSILHNFSYEVEAFYVMFQALSLKQSVP